MIAIGSSTDRYLGIVREAPQRPKRPDIQAKYDAASDSVEFQNYWANTDAYDADSANSKSVRARLVKRSRYESANNAYADGIVQTHANFLVGLGPSLQCSPRIDAAFASWALAVSLRRKLWCCAHQSASRPLSEAKQTTHSAL